MNMASDNLYKALCDVSLGYSEGIVTIDALIKACDTYKSKTDFDDGLDYQILVSKSCYDHINGVGPDPEISKAILPGQTKNIDGVMYVYSPTKPGSKEPYDWHVVRTVGKGKEMDDDEAEKKQKYVNELFPKDLKSLKVIQAAGGSTGAQIVEDVNGNRYIMKRGDASSNTNNSHIKNEYLANQLYDALGMKVPEFELYDDNGTAVLLSKFIPGTKAPTAKDFPEMAKGFVADCIMANWDVYQNDNCLIDYAGQVIRVDNGGSLIYRAQGKTKPFTDSVLDTFNSMSRYSSNVYSTLSFADIKKQIADIKSKKKDIVDFLKESGQDALADTIAKRIDSLKSVSTLLDKQTAIKDVPIESRDLKDPDEMYRVLTDDELQEMWDNVKEKDSYRKFMDTGSNGWSLLSEICKARGFDARPEVVTEDEYWKRIPKNQDRQFFRGLNKDYISTDYAVKSFLFDDNCFYGTQGVYGSGIYAHRNDKNGVTIKSTETNYKQSASWGHARTYSGMGGGIVKGFINDDAKIVKFEDIRRELNNMVYTKDPQKAKQIQNEINDIDKEISDIQDKIDNVGKEIAKEVHEKMHYNEDALKAMEVEIDSVDWGKKNAFDEREIPSFADFVEGNISKWVREQGGTVTQRKGVVTFTLPNSDEPLSINAYQYDGPFSIKQKNMVSAPYNGAVRRFQEWMEREHVQKVADAVKTAIDGSGERVNKLNDEKRQAMKIRSEKNNELQSLAKDNSDKTLWGGLVANKNLNEPIGVLAALKGYDAIECRNGNGSSNSFFIILNRSKITVSNGIDYT